MVLTETEIETLILAFVSFVKNPDTYWLPHNHGEELKEEEIEQLYNYAYENGYLQEEKNVIEETVQKNLDELIKSGKVFSRYVDVFRYRGEKQCKNRQRSKMPMSDKQLKRLINRGDIICGQELVYIAKEHYVLTDDDAVNLQELFCKFLMKQDFEKLDKSTIPKSGQTPLGKEQYIQMLQFLSTAGYPK